MELSIIKQLKQTLYQLRRGKPAKHKVVQIVEKPTKTKAIARNKTIVNIDGRELSLSRIAQLYNLEPHTVYARYRVGNRGKLLIRPSHRQQKPT